MKPLQRSRRINSRLAAHAGTRQVESLVHADAAATAVVRAVLVVWRELTALARQPGQRLDLWTLQARAQALAERLSPLVRSTLSDKLARLALWSHQAAADTLARTLPRDYLNAIYVQRNPQVFPAGVGLGTVDMAES